MPSRKLSTRVLPLVALAILAISYLYKVSPSVSSSLVSDLESHPQEIKETSEEESCLVPLKAQPSAVPPPLPWIHVGMPKSGTTSLEQFWNCNATTSHQICKVTSAKLITKMGGGGGPRNGGPCPSDRIAPCRTCADCFRAAVQEGLPPLQNCGAYQAYTQLDSLRFCLWPQITNLEDIHREQPHATLVWMHRNLTDWVRSVKAFREGQTHRRFVQCELPFLPKGKGVHAEELQEFYCKSLHYMRQFVQEHPTHQLLEFRLEDPDLPQQLETTFGINAQTCWGKLNVNQGK